MGNASTTSVDKVITDLRLTEEDTPNAELAFINSHSISAATPFGSEVHGAYEYGGQTYTGRFMRGEDFFACNQCHDQHTLELQFDTCGQCHTINGSTPQDIRVKTNDFDGDGDIQEGIAFEIEYFREALLAAIQSYATKTSGVSIAYTAETYPYFFTDSNKNGAVDSDEATADNWYVNWTPRMLRAAYNYNYVIHDPGAFAHNSTYTLQILFDSLGNIGGDTIGLSRP
ncbi:MAG TPA: polyheme membrane-associated cytochrome C [Chloroflexi bacterium]|nr:polyheme membrane-associated cytochrome C [Chloroflexota bacterium]